MSLSMTPPNPLSPRDTARRSALARLSGRCHCLPLLLLVLTPPTAASERTAIERGVSAWQQGNLSAAAQAWRQAAETGDPRAQALMGYLHEQASGPLADRSKAAHWYAKAASQGVPQAQYRLGVLYEMGSGVDQDMAEAEYWYSQAINQDFCPGELSVEDLFYRQTDGH